MHGMVLNLAAYHFVRIDEPAALAGDLRKSAQAGALRGTVLVAGEGLNLFLAGAEAQVQAFLVRLRADPRFTGIGARFSRRRSPPAARLKVKVKPEIIAFRRDGASPLAGRAPAVAPDVLARWIGLGQGDHGP